MPRFSNPNIPYDGQPIGDVWNDNARKINDVSAIIASYYQHSSACGSTPCSDGDICNGVETCDRLSGQCVAGIPTLCDSSFGCSSLPQCTAALTSTFNGGNRGGGNFFQVDALSHLFITRFDIHILQETHVQVYTKTGNYVGFESDSTAWTLIHSEEMGNPEGDGNATPLSPFDGGAVEMLAGSTQSFYVLSTNPLEYTNGEGEGGVFREDAHLRIREGKGSPSFFSTSTFSPRIFNGNIEYIPTTSCRQRQPAPQQLQYVKSTRRDSGCKIRSNVFHSTFFSPFVPSFSSDFYHDGRTNYYQHHRKFSS